MCSDFRAFFNDTQAYFSARCFGLLGYADSGRQTRRACTYYNHLLTGCMYILKCKQSCFSFQKRFINKCLYCKIHPCLSAPCINGLFENMKSVYSVNWNSSSCCNLCRAMERTRCCLAVTSRSCHSVAVWPRSRSLASCSSLLSLVTFQQWKGMPAISAVERESSWLETIATTSIGNSPVRQR